MRKYVLTGLCWINVGLDQTKIATKFRNENHPLPTTASISSVNHRSLAVCVDSPEFPTLLALMKAKAQLGI